MKRDETTIAIMGEDIPAQLELVDIYKLRFLPDNPRVYAATQQMADFNDLTSDEKQHRIYECLLLEPSVKKLRPEIKRDGGLQEPIVVRHDTFQVIEGNSRLAVYRKLHDETDDERWTHIRCLVVSKLTDDQQTRLFSQPHLIGRTEWSPHAKALLCFRWNEGGKNGASELASLTGFTPATVKKEAKIIELMNENSDERQSHFSHYEVLVRNKAISSAIAESPTLRETLLELIQDEAFPAQKMRDQLPTVLNKPRVLRKFEKGHITLEEAYDRAKISGTEQHLKRVHSELEHIEKSDIYELERSSLKASEQLLRKIRQALKRVSNMISAELARNKD